MCRLVDRTVVPHSAKESARVRELLDAFREERKLLIFTKQTRAYLWLDLR